MLGDGDTSAGHLQQGPALIAVLVLAAIAAAAIMSRRDIPPALMKSLYIFGSFIVGGCIVLSILVPILLRQPRVH